MPVDQKKSVNEMKRTRKTKTRYEIKSKDTIDNIEERDRITFREFPQPCRVARE